MARGEYRGGWGQHAVGGRGDLTRKAVVIGALLTVAVIAVATLTVVLGPHKSGHGEQEGGLGAFIGAMMAKGDDDSDEESSDSDSDDDSTSSEEASTSTTSVSDEGSSAGSTTPAGSTAGKSCTKIASDEASLDQILQSAGVNDVVCYRSKSAPSSGGTSAMQGGPPGAATPQQGNCTKQVTDAAGLTQAISGGKGGDRICVKGDLSSARLNIKKGGASGSPLAVIGDGATKVKGITVAASNVHVEGFQVVKAEAPGIELRGNAITVQNNTVNGPTSVGGGADGDGMRFFGDNIKIVHNTVKNINPQGTQAHADCMQTFTNDEKPSSHLLVDGNRCEKIDNQCLMAEGPGDVGDGGGGPGESVDWTLSNNYCQVISATQVYMIEAVQNVKIKNNEFVGKSLDKAIGLDIKSTGAEVSANKLVGIKAAVGMSADSKKGYKGPPPNGGP